MIEGVHDTALCLRPARLAIKLILEPLEPYRVIGSHGLKRHTSFWAGL